MLRSMPVRSVEVQSNNNSGHLPDTTAGRQTAAQRALANDMAGEEGAAADWESS